jgi:hypothetical protein
VNLKKLLPCPFCGAKVSIKYKNKYNSSMCDFEKIITYDMEIECENVCFRSNGTLRIVGKMKDEKYKNQAYNELIELFNRRVK